MAKIYMAGPPFGAADRVHNLLLERTLQRLGHKIVLPQRSALKFFDAEHSRFDVKAMAEDCRAASMDPEMIYLGNIDGTDADSGTAIEFGMAMGATGRAIVYRTDFRTDPEKEIGLNAMFQIKGAKFLYYPCHFTQLDQVVQYYEGLAALIDSAIKAIELETKTEAKRQVS